MNVSNEVKAAYKSNSITKHITLYFPELDKEIGMKQIYSESMHLSESLLENNSIEFVGCISSEFKIQVNGLREDIKGKKITARIHTDGTAGEPVVLFHGIVDSAIRQSNKQIKEITAYDELYTKGNKDVSSWYKSVRFPVTLKQIRDSLFDYIGIRQVETELPNDGIVISKQYDPNTLQALSVIKAVCQINGAFGIINRNGVFEYRILAQKIESTPYPAFTLFPAAGLFPANPDVAMAVAERLADKIEAENFSFYKSVNYEEFSVKPVDKLTIRQTEDDTGVSYGNGENNYIIQGNMFTYGLPGSILRTMAQNIYGNVQGFSYFPFISNNNGLPFLECGLDAASYMMIDYEALDNNKIRSGDIPYKQQSFYILNRELSGIQALRDSYSADGEEYQSEFITDLQTQIDVLKQNATQNFEQKLTDYTYDKSTIDGMFANMGGGGIANIVSVPALPANTDPNTLYLIQGEVIVE